MIFPKESQVSGHVSFQEKKKKKKKKNTFFTYESIQILFEQL